jgi:hypothetical protein
VPDLTTAPPTTETADEAIARLNQELAEMRGDWTQSQRKRIDPDQVELLTNTVAKGCNLHELNYLLEVGGRYGLSPFLGQIFAAKFDGEDGPVTIFTGRDGMLQAARNTGRFVRIVSNVVREHDVFEVETALGGDVENLDPAKGVQVDPATRLVHMREGMGRQARHDQGAYALAYRLGDPFPTYAEASWEDYGATRQQDLDGKPTSWTLNHRDGFPEAMMVKVPQSISLRLAFGLSGLVSAEELGDRPQRVQNLTSSTASTWRQGAAGRGGVRRRRPGPRAVRAGQGRERAEARLVEADQGRHADQRPSERARGAARHAPPGARVDGRQGQVAAGGDPVHETGRGARAGGAR